MTLTLGPRDLALTHSREASAQRKVRANHTAQRKSGRSPMRLRARGTGRDNAVEAATGPYERD